MFILIIDDINTNTTIIKPVAKNQASTIRDSVNNLFAKSDENKCQLNESKLMLRVVENEVEFAPIVINKKTMKVVPSVKLLGLNISKDLKWNFYVSEIFPQGLCKVLFPQATEEGKCHNQGSHNFLHNMHLSGHRIRFSSF